MPEGSTIPMPEPPRTRYTLAEWHAEAERRFGASYQDWKFVCPACGHVQKVIDFRPYKDAGANPNSAYQECIGRYEGVPRSATKESGKGPCDYAGYGLIDLCPVTVVMEDGREIKVFDFAIV